jgi:hypothetical protein
MPNGTNGTELGAGCVSNCTPSVAVSGPVLHQDWPGRLPAYKTYRRGSSWLSGDVVVKSKTCLLRGDLQEMKACGQGLTQALRWRPAVPAIALHLLCFRPRDTPGRARCVLPE